MTLYLDTSALTKLIVDEHESPALLRYLSGRSDLASSALTRTELIRAVRRRKPDAEEHARAIIARLDLVEVRAEILEHAATIGHPGLRTLDAVHVATALALGDDLEALVTYDTRMTDAARSAGIEVLAPGKS